MNKDIMNILVSVFRDLRLFISGDSGAYSLQITMRDQKQVNVVFTVTIYEFL